MFIQTACITLLLYINIDIIEQLKVFSLNEFFLLLMHELAINFFPFMKRMMEEFGQITKANIFRVSVTLYASLWCIYNQI